MFEASTKGKGRCESFPDVCRRENGKMEAYTNKAELHQADGETCSTKVRIRNKKVCTQKTEIRIGRDETGHSIRSISKVSIFMFAPAEMIADRI